MSTDTLGYALFLFTSLELKTRLIQSWLAANTDGCRESMNIISKTTLSVQGADVAGDLELNIVEALRGGS